MQGDGAMTYTIETAKGTWTGETLEAAWAKQEEMQGAAATLVLPMGQRVDIESCESMDDVRRAIRREMHLAVGGLCDLCLDGGASLEEVLERSPAVVVARRLVAGDISPATELYAFCETCASQGSASSWYGYEVEAGEVPDGTPWASAWAMDTQIEKLRDEAGEAGDLAQARLCALALEGDGRARAKCVAAIESARAMED